MHFDLITDTAPHLDAIARQAFEVLAGMVPVSRFANSQVPDSLEVDAWVSYNGGQNTPGRLLIRTNTRFALEFSQRFLGLPTLAEIDDDVLDAIGELANTVGGNLKGLLNADTILSTPIVSKVKQNSDLHPAVNAHVQLDYAFDGDGLCLIKLLGPNGGCECKCT